MSLFLVLILLIGFVQSDLANIDTVFENELPPFIYDLHRSENIANFAHIRSNAVPNSFRVQKEVNDRYRNRNTVSMIYEKHSHAPSPHNTQQSPSSFTFAALSSLISIYFRSTTAWLLSLVLLTVFVQTNYNEHFWGKWNLYRPQKTDELRLIPLILPISQRNDREGNTPSMNYQRFRSRRIWFLSLVLLIVVTQTNFNEHPSYLYRPQNAHKLRHIPLPERLMMIKTTDRAFSPSDRKANTPSMKYQQPSRAPSPQHHRPSPYETNTNCLFTLVALSSLISIYLIRMRNKERLVLIFSLYFGMTPTAATTETSLGKYHSCVLRAHAIKCWGSGWNGKLGYDYTCPCKFSVVVLRTAGTIAATALRIDGVDCSSKRSMFT